MEYSDHLDRVAGKLCHSGALERLASLGSDCLFQNKKLKFDTFLVVDFSTKDSMFNSESQANRTARRIIPPAAPFEEILDGDLARIVEGETFVAASSHLHSNVRKKKRKATQTGSEQTVGPVVCQ